MYLVQNSEELKEDILQELGELQVCFLFHANEMGPTVPFRVLKMSAPSLSPFKIYVQIPLMANPKLEPYRKVILGSIALDYN